MSPRNENLLDRPLLGLSATDYLTLRRMSGVLVVGDPGSGKSQNIGKQLCLAMIRAGFGGLLHAIKSDDRDNFIAWACEAHREADILAGVRKT